MIEFMLEISHQSLKEINSGVHAMDSMELKIMQSTFNRNLKSLAEDLEAVVDGDITGIQAGAVIQMAREKLVEYERIKNIFESKASILGQQFVKSNLDFIESLRESLSTLPSA
jgi:hypothetical protein